MKPSLSVTQNGASITLGAMIDRGRAMQSFLNRNVYRIYQNAQRERWMSENASQGREWARLNTGYAARKRRIYASYEGGGTKMLIATGRLFKSVIGPGNGQRKIVTNTKLYISTNVEYAGFVDGPDAKVRRSFSEWGPTFRAKLKRAISDFIIKNIRREE